ncbi:SAF domain-containing protein [Janibacter sp. LM]|uniref:SAF domain-containing protein n=1 Tax=Janibacter sp. LM TaxID=3144845 RepID=UPI0031F6D395
MTAPTPAPPPEQATRRTRSGKDSSNVELATAPEPPKLRRRPMLVALSVLLIALGALLGAWLLSSLSGTESYVAVREDVQRGEQIQETDLVRTQLKRDGAISPVLWSQQGVIVGTYATVDMAKGSLVTRESVAAEIAPRAGHREVGLALMPGQSIAGELRNGEPIEVVIVPASADAGAPQEPVAGYVLSARMSEDGQTRLVDVEVPESQAKAITAAASRQEVAIQVASAQTGSDAGASEDTGSTGSTSPSSSSTSS